MHNAQIIHCPQDYLGGVSFDLSLPVLGSTRVITGVPHGLNTYSRMAEDVIKPGFAEAVAEGMVDMVACQALLDRIASQGFKP